jgi:hypothetical protein
MPSSYRILNLVLSHDAAAGRDLRMQMRSTWLAFRRISPEYRHLFVIGGAASAGIVGDDELWLPTDDSYRGGPAKIIDALAYVVQHEGGGKYTHLLKSDDDTVVCVPQLMAYLHKINMSMTGVYAGRLQIYLPELTSWGEGHKFSDLNYGTVFNRTRYELRHIARSQLTRPRAQPRLHSCHSYSDYHLGGGYMLSFDVVQHVVSTARQLGFLPGGHWREARLMPAMEDAFIGRLVTLSGYAVDKPQLAFSTRAEPNSAKLKLQYPQYFCYYLFRPKVACNKLMSEEWCKANGPLVLVHPVDIIHGARYNGTSGPLDRVVPVNGSGVATRARKMRQTRGRAHRGGSGHQH